MARIRSIHAATDYTLANGGGTFEVRPDGTLSPVEYRDTADAYVVAIVARDAIVVPADPGSIRLGVARAIREYPDAPYIGTWVNDGQCHVDPVIILPDRESAIRVGRAFSQLAIYNLATDETIDVA